jgi:transcriptional regulator with XRE-family HTH domain
MTPDELRARRTSLGMTQAELAAALGTVKDTISRWERGTRGIEHPEMLTLALDQLAARQKRRGPRKRADRVS